MDSSTTSVPNPSPEENALSSLIQIAEKAFPIFATRMELGIPIHKWDIEIGPYIVRLGLTGSIQDMKIRNSILNWCDRKGVHEEDAILSETTEYLTKKCFQALRMAFTTKENHDLAMDEMAKLQQLLEKNKVNIEKLYGYDGFVHALECINGRILNGGSYPWSSPSVLYEDLSELDQASVKAMVVMFNRIIGEPLDKQRGLLEEALKIGSEIGEWHLLHFSILRSIRNEDEKTFRDPPSSAETNALGNAFRLLPEKESILLHICKTLLDFIKYSEKDVNGNVDCSLTFNIGSLSFHRSEAAQALCSRLRDILENSPENVEALVYACFLFTNVRVPFPLRDAVFAKACIDKAIELDPTSGKPYHKAAHLFMQEKNLVAAKENFKKAMAADPLDYLPLIDYLWAASSELRPEIVQTFDKILKFKMVFSWPNHALTDIHFVKGCLHVGLDQESIAAYEFKESYSLSPAYFAIRIKTVTGRLRFNCWNYRLVNLQKILVYLKKYVETNTELSENDSKQLEEMIKIAEDVQEKANEKRAAYLATKQQSSKESERSENWRERREQNGYHSINGFDEGNKGPGQNMNRPRGYNRGGSPASGSRGYPGSRLQNGDSGYRGGFGNRGNGRFDNAENSGHFQRGNGDLYGFKKYSQPRGGFGNQGHQKFDNFEGSGNEGVLAAGEE